jgi:tetratricopeptide (TPR) repeat protein
MDFTDDRKIRNEGEHTFGYKFDRRCIHPLELKRYDDAIEAYRQAIQINPENADTWYSLGLLYYDLGNQTAALDAVRELRRLDPAKADKLFKWITPR